MIGKLMNNNDQYLRLQTLDEDVKDKALEIAYLLIRDGLTYDNAILKAIKIAIIWGEIYGKDTKN